MFIPSWCFWILAIFVWITLIVWVGKTDGSYDFVSPLLAAMVFFAGIAFGVGYLIAA